jgi:hypothetical protein
MERINKNFTRTIAIPLVAAITSMGLALGSLFDIKSLESNKSSPFLAIIVSSFGLILAFLFVKVILKNRGPKTFVVYSYTDKKFVETLVKRLRSKRFRVTYDDEVVNVGDNIKETINNKIKDSDTVILVLSQTEKTNDWISLELKKAIEYNKKILPIILTKDAFIPLDVRGLKYADFSDDELLGFRQLSSSLLKTPNENQNTQ